MRYFLQLAYKGTAYHGWQIQPNAHTLQALFNEKLSLMLGEEIYCIGCGRTDTGVHASCFYLHFDTEKLLDRNLVPKLNSFLPKDVAVQALYRSTHEDAHARFSAIARTYTYRLVQQKDPFSLEYAAFIYHPLDLEAMQQAAAILPEYEDFEALSKYSAEQDHHRCRLFSATWERKGHELVFTVSANRFLRGMVRLMVGALLDVGRHKRSTEDLRALLENRDRKLGSAAAPAEGLYLSDVVYPPGLLEKIS